MDLHSLTNALLLGVIEGLTEFLPISSTGHLILVSDLLGLNDEKGKVFDIVIQLGAILAVCWEYRARFARAFSGLARDPVQQRFATNLAVAFLRAVSPRLQSQSRRTCSPDHRAVACRGRVEIFVIERCTCARRARVTRWTSNLGER